MKKRLCFLLILALALAPLPALAAEGDAILGKDEDGNSTYFNYAFAQGDTAWFVAGSTTMYAWRAGDADLTECTLALPEREAGENLSDDLLPFCVDGQLYALDLLTRYDEDAQFIGATLCRLTGEGPEFGIEEVGEVDWSELTEYYDQNSYATRPDNLIGLPGKVGFRAYDSSGDYRVYLLDVAACRLECLEEAQAVNNLSAYRDGAMLVCQYNYDQPDVCRLSACDADGTLQPLAQVTVPEYSPLTAMAYDEESDTIYCVKGGEICPVDLQAGEIGAGVTDMPLEVYGNSAAFVLPGGYYVVSGDGAAVRNLDPGQRAEVRLKINDSGWNDCVNTAYYRYSNAHGEVSCVLSRDWNESQNLLENMMNRDDSIDIYTLSTSSPIYDALYKRGYLMELDGSEALATFADSLYPDIRDALSTNGRLVAIPVSLNAWTLGVNEKALEALDMTIEDVPDNWMDFLDFLVSLEEPLKAGKVHLFYEGYTTEDARNDMFYAIFEAYQRYVNAVDPAMGYNTDLLRTLLTKAENIDFAALGLPEPVEDDENGMNGRSVTYSEEAVLMQTSVGCTIGEFYSDYTPILMGLDADTPMPLVLNADVAFINPFTKHPEEALAFMETLADSLSTGVRYDINPDLNEVIRGKQNEDSLREAQKWVDDTNAQLEGADEADRQMLEETLAMAEENLRYWENYGWEVGQRDLDWYRGHDDKLLLSGVQWIYADDSGEGWELISQYRDHQISLDEMLAGIDRKVQMMLMEGN